MSDNPPPPSPLLPIWLTSLITLTVGGQGGQVESAIYPRGSFLNSPALLINGAAPLSVQIYIRMHAGRRVNNGRQVGVGGGLGLAPVVREEERWRTCACTAYEG